MHRTVRRLVAVLVLALAFVGLWAGVASAHASLIDSTPAAASVLTTAPREVVLHFDEDVEASLGGIDVVKSDGTRVAAGPTQAVPGDATRVRAALPALDAGTYVVAWRVTSADGHPVQGTFSFQVGSGAAQDTTGLATQLLTAERGNRTVGALVVAARLLTYTAVALLLGALAFCAVAWPALAARWPARRLAWYGWALALVAVGAAFVLQGPYVAGRPAGDVLDTALWRDVASTRFGHAALARLAVLVALAPVVALVRLCRTAVWRLAAVVGGLALAFAVAYGGHASTGRWPALGLATDTAHVAGMAVWLGGLATLGIVALAVRPAITGPPVVHGDVAAEVAGIEGTEAGDEGQGGEGGEGRPGNEPGSVPMSVGAAAAPPQDPLTAAVHRFSTVAFGCVVVLVLTGLVQSWRILGGISGLLDTTYGRLLATKVAVVVLLILLGALSRYVVRRYWPARSELRRVVASELVVGVAVLAVTAALVGAAPARAGKVPPFTANLVKGDLIASVSVDPPKVGNGELHLYVTLPGGSLARLQDAKARLTFTGRNDGPVPVDLQPAGPNHYLAAVQFPYAGPWELELLLSPSAGQQVRLTTTIPVRSS